MRVCLCLCMCLCVCMCAGECVTILCPGLNSCLCSMEHREHIFVSVAIIQYYRRLIRKIYWMNKRWICLSVHFALHVGHFLRVWIQLRMHGSQKPCPQNVVHIWFNGYSSKQIGHWICGVSRVFDAWRSGLNAGIDEQRSCVVVVCAWRLRRDGLSGVSVSEAHRSTTAVIRRSPGVSPTKITSSSSSLRFGIYSSTNMTLSIHADIVDAKHRTERKTRTRTEEN